MKVLQIIDKLDVGGAERVLINLSNILFENNMDVSVLCLLNKSELDSELHSAIPIYYLGRKNKFNPFMINKLYHLLQKFDIVHIHSRHILRYVGLLLFLPKVYRSFRVVYHDHSLLELEANFKEKGYLLRLIRKVDATIVVSEEQKYFFPKGIPISLLENIVRSSKLRVDLQPNRKKLVAIGNFRRIKNYSFLFEILERLPPEYSCDIYVNSIEKSYFLENKNVIQMLVDENKLQIIQGELDIQSQLINYSLAIHPSLSESGPLAAVECLSVGLPILIYNTGAVAKRIIEKIPELVKNDNNCEHWVQSIVQYHKDFNTMNTYSSELYQLYLETYSEENYFKKCLKIYNRILSS